MMKSKFSGFYQLTDKEFEELWRNCVFILDANVLLNLYRFPTQAREDLLKILVTISNRLWIPYHAALEYQENRLQVIAEQIKKFDDVRKVLQDTKNRLRAGLEQLQLSKRHSVIKAEGLIGKIEDLIDEFKRELDTLEDQQQKVHDFDNIREQIDSLLDGKVGQPPNSQEELDNLYEEAQRRYGRGQPPGYLDANKENGGFYNYGGLCFQRKYGDFVLWHEIIEESRKRDDFKRVILVTDDRKEDWWWVVPSKGEKTVGPRPELVDEIKAKAGVLSFYIYNSERFLEFATRYLGVAVDKESIEQVRDLTDVKELAARLDEFLTEIGPRLRGSATSSLRTQLLAVLTSRFSNVAELGHKAKIVVSPSSDTQEWLRIALGNYGVSFVPVVVAASERTIALERGVVDAVMIEHHPSPLVAAHIASGNVQVLPWSERAVEAVIRAFPEATMATILPPETYEGQREPLLGYAPR